MSHRLVVNPRTPQAWTIELKPGLNRIGRTAENDFPIQHSSISAQHCEITVTAAGVTLKDLGAANGTFVERVPVTEFQLQHNHRVQLGSVELVFESTGLPDLPDAVNLPADGARIMVANPTPAAPPPPPPPPGTSFARKSMPAEEFEPEPGTTDRATLGRGLAGAVGGGLAGTLGWYLLIKWTQMEIGYAAIMVGAATGAGARLLARQGSKTLGLGSASCALVAIIFCQCFALVTIRDREIEQRINQEYKKELKWARSAVELTNTAEIVYFLSVRNEVNESDITEPDIKKFKEVDLPAFRDLLSKTTSNEDFAQARKAATPVTPLTAKLSIFTFVWSLLGIATAWHIGSSRDSSA